MTQAHQADQSEASIVSDSSWHLSKSVPLALILAILVQTVGAVWWASSITANVTQNAAAITRAEAQIETLRTTSQTQAVQLGRIEEGISAMKGDLSRIVRILEAQQ